MDLNWRKVILALAGLRKGTRGGSEDLNMKVVYQSTYALPQPDFSSIALAVKNTNPDVVVGCTYFPDSVGIAQGLSRDGFALKFMAETMVRLKPSSQKRSDRLSPRR